jgi:hypothetical protein
LADSASAAFGSTWDTCSAIDGASASPSPVGGDDASLAAAIEGWASELVGAGTAAEGTLVDGVAGGLADSLTPVGGVGPGTDFIAPVAAALTAEDTGALTSGVLRGTTRAAATGAPLRCTRAAASVLTRCSISAARSGARPAHSRKRLISRAWENANSDKIAIPTKAANAAMAPTSVNELESDSASG